MTNPTDAEKMREACAKLAQTYNLALTSTTDGDMRAEVIAAAIRALPLPAPARTYEDGVQLLINAVERINAACDAMWNDTERLEENPHRMGQVLQLKMAHVKAISEAQQALPTILALIKEPDNG